MDSSITDLLNSVVHPYSKYGLAVALYVETDRDLLDEPTLANLLAEAIESGLEHFRMRTDDRPGDKDTLQFTAIAREQLEANTKWVQSAGLAAQGVYLYPAVVTTDGDAKGTFENSQAIIGDLKASKLLRSPYSLSRSFAPTTAKINNGKPSQSEPRGTLLEAAGAVIATLTEVKPAAWINGRNTVIIPDLPLNELYDFVELFSKMWTSEMDGSLMEAKLSGKKVAAQTSTKSVQKKSAIGGVEKSEYRRPRLHNGNYPFAPQRDGAALGPVGLLGAIGRWAVEAKQTPWAERVLVALTDKPLYVISYDAITQVQFGHHIVGLSRNGQLSEIVRALAYDTRLGSEIEQDRPAWDDPTRKLFHLAASRFLQFFTLPAFRDFLAFRTEYPSTFNPMFKEYFMEKRKIPNEIVQSAGAFGQWLNRSAYFVADADVEKSKPERAKDVRKAKAKIIVTMESVAMSAKTPQAMMSQVMIQAGRLIGDDAPPEAKPFIDAVMAGDFENPDDAKHLLMTYLRLRAAGKENKDRHDTDTNEPIGE